MAEEENVELTAEEAQDAQVEQDGISDEDLDRIADTAIATIQDILKHFDVGEVTIDEYEGDEGELILDITGDDLAVLIGRHGKTLDCVAVPGVGHYRSHHGLPLSRYRRC